MMPPSPTEVVQRLLASTRNAAVLNDVVAPDATYVSLNYSNPSLTKILPYAGTHEKSGPQAVIDTFTTVNTIWANEAFEVQALFASLGECCCLGSLVHRLRRVTQTLNTILKPGLALLLDLLAAGTGNAWRSNKVKKREHQNSSTAKACWKDYGNR